MHRNVPTKQPIYGLFSTTELGVGDISGVMVPGTVGDTGAQFNAGEGTPCLSSRELGATALTVRPETLQPDTETPVTLDAEEAARKKILRSNTNRLNNWYGEPFIKGELNSDGSYAGNGARELLAPYMEQLDFAFQLKKIIPNPHQALQTLRANHSYIAAILERHYYEQGEIRLTEPKNPYELAASVGYKLHGPLNLVDEVAAFERDYRGGERLCTFKEIPERLKQYHIMWLRHNDADDTLPANELTADNLSEAWKQYLRIINRYDPETDRYDLIRLAPTREDPYGVSSMSVQISRSGNHVSIKNRYNHTVTNPDNTYSNDLDAVAHGLRHALYHHVGRDDLMKLGNTKLGDNYTLDNDGGIHYYYYEKDNVYLGHYEYIKNGLVTKIDKGHYDMLSPTLYVSKDGQGKLAGIDDATRSNIKVLADGRHELVLYGDKGSPTHTYHYTYDDKGFVVNLELAVEAAAEVNDIFRNPNLTNLTIAEGAKTQDIYENPNLTNLTIAEGAKTQGICENPNLTNLTIAEGAEAGSIYDNPNLTNLTIAEGAKTWSIYGNPNLTSLTIAEGAIVGG